MVKIISKYPFFPTLPTWGFHQAKEPFGYDKCGRSHKLHENRENQVNSYDASLTPFPHCYDSYMQGNA